MNGLILDKVPVSVLTTRDKVPSGQTASTMGISFIASSKMCPSTNSPQSPRNMCQRRRKWQRLQRTHPAKRLLNVFDANVVLAKVNNVRHEACIFLDEGLLSEQVQIQRLLCFPKPRPQVIVRTKTFHHSCSSSSSNSRDLASQGHTGLSSRLWSQFGNGRRNLQKRIQTQKLIWNLCGNLLGAKGY